LVLCVACDSPTAPTVETFDLRAGVAAGSATIEFTTPSAWLALEHQTCAADGAPAVLGDLPAGAYVRAAVDAGCHVFRWRYPDGRASVEVDVAPGETVRLQWSNVRLTVPRG
jgi:hypothetical protein